jgi:hypothetical protein
MLRERVGERDLLVDERAGDDIDQGHASGIVKEVATAVMRREIILLDAFDKPLSFGRKLGELCRLRDASLLSTCLTLMESCLLSLLGLRLRRLRR